MYKILLALHLVVAVFAIGPLVAAATTAGRGVRKADPVAATSSARMLKLYSYASVLVVVLGVGVMSSKSAYTHKTTAEFGDTWIWLSIVLWLVAVGLVLGLVVPTLDKAVDLLSKEQPVDSLTARVAAGGGVVGLIFIGIVFLMVYRPGN